MNRQRLFIVNKSLLCVLLLLVVQFVFPYLTKVTTVHAAGAVDVSTALEVPTGLDTEQEKVAMVIGLPGDRFGILYFTGVSPTRTFYYKVIDRSGTVLFTKNVNDLMGARASNVYTLKAYALAGGKTAITWEGTKSGCDNNTNNMFQFLILDQNGNIVKNVTDISTVTASYNCYTSGAELSNGHIVFIWQHAGNEYYMRIFDENGNSVNQPVSITKTGTREGLSSYDSVYGHSLAANKNGSFMIAYSTNNSSYYYGVLYNNDGTQKSVNGYNHFILSQNPKSGSTLNVLAALSNQQFALYYATGASGDRYLKIFNDDGTASGNDLTSGFTTVSGDPVTGIKGTGPFSLTNGGFILYVMDTANKKVYAKHYQNDGISDSTWNLVDTNSYVTFNAFRISKGYDRGFGIYNDATGKLVLHGMPAGNPTYTVTYYENGSTSGTVPVENNPFQQGATVTIAGNTGNLLKTGYTFAGWNTAEDGSGATYNPGATFTMGSSNVKLYAKWIPQAAITVGPVSGSTGDLVDVPVKVSSATEAIYSYTFQMNFDAAKLEAVSFTSDAGDAFDALLDTDNVFVVADVDSTGTSPFTNGQELFTLTFQIKDGTALGDYPLTLDSVVVPKFYTNGNKRMDVSFTFEKPTPAINSVSVSPGSASVLPGGSKQLTATVSAVGGAAETVTWTSSDATNKVTVDSTGLVTVAADAAPGDYTITATSTVDTSKKGTATITVTAAPAINSVSVSPGSASVLPGGSKQLTATVSAVGGAAETVTWTSSDATNKVTVDSTGLVTVAADAAPGDYTITATSTVDTSKKGTATITVTAAPAINSVSVSPGSASVLPGGSKQLTATVSAVGGAAETVTWTSSDATNKVTVDSTGLVTVAADAAPGDYTITATSTVDTSKKGTATITVTAAPAINSVSVSPGSASVLPGGSKQLTATVSAVGGAAETVTWTSSDATNKVTVDPTGLVTVAADAEAGDYTITATSTIDTSKKGTATITVTAAPAINSVSVSPGSASVLPGGSKQLTATVSAVGGAAETVTWTSSDATNKVTVDSTGLVTVAADAAPGDYTITAISIVDTSKKGTATITVTAAPAINSVSISPSSSSVLPGGSKQLTATVSAVGGAAETVTWTSSDATNKVTVDSTGLVTVAADAEPGDYTITATSTVDTSKKGTATITVTAAPAINSVSVSPGSASVLQGGSKQLTVTVSAVGGAAETVTWTSSDAMSKVTVDSTGLVTVAADAAPGDYTITATSTVDTSKKGTATITVTAAPPQDLEVTAVKTLPAVTGIPNGTAKTATALGLPKQVEVELSDNRVVMIDVRWNVEDADYDPAIKESQSFAVTGSLVNLPNGVRNTADVKASIRVRVDAAEEEIKEIVEVTEPNAITGVANGTAKTAAALGLPKKVEVMLSDGSTLQVAVQWDVEGTSYDPDNPDEQSFRVTGTLLLPEGITNPKDKTVSIRVSVKAADPEEEIREIVAVTEPEPIRGVENGTAKTADALGLPDEVEVTLDDDSTLDVRVKWDVRDAEYDPDETSKQSFTVTGALTRLPKGIVNSQNLVATIRVTVNAAKRDRDRDNDRDKDSSSGGSDSKFNDRTSNESTRQVTVEAGNDRSLKEQVEITRTIDREGKKIDEVALDKKKAQDILQKAAENQKDVVRIVIDDLPNNPADEVIVKVHKASLNLIKDQGVSLEIKTGDVTIAIPKEMVALLGDDLYFRVVPIHKPEEKQNVIDRALNAEEVSRAANGQQVEIVGKPMTIETNYSNRRTKVMFPLEDVKLPADPTAQRIFLSSLGVYIEHSDGEKVLKTGEIKYDANGKPLGIEIEIDKFSTFTLISLKGKQERVQHQPYMTGYPDQTFKPNRALTRAEMAAILAHFLKAEEQPTAAEIPADIAFASTSPFVDVPTTHWAASAIQLVRSAGLMTGDGNGLFQPNAKITRAEMAAIITKWKQLSANGKAARFTDTDGHWAEASIAAAVEAGVMNGYENGSFRPNQGLTRAEAVTLFNRLTGRGPLSGMTQASWSDVPATHWAFSEIVEAAVPHVALKGTDGAEVVTKE